MRIVVLAVALVLSVLGAAGRAFAEEARASDAACDARKIGGRDLAECLRGGAERAERELAATMEAATKSIEARQGLLSSQKTRWRRALNEAETQWVNWRDLECQDVAPFEAGMASKDGDPRLRCIIDDDAERVASLKARYP